MEAKEKAAELVEKMYGANKRDYDRSLAIECAIIAIKNEYHSLRELLFNLKSVRVIENDKVYLSRLQGLIDEEQEILIEIENL